MLKEEEWWLAWQGVVKIYSQRANEKITSLHSFNNNTTIQCSQNKTEQSTATVDATTITENQWQKFMRAGDATVYCE